MNTTKKIILTKSAIIILAVLFSIFLVFNSISNSTSYLITSTNQITFSSLQKETILLFSILIGLIGFCSLITINNHFSFKKNIKIINLIVLFLTIILIIVLNSTFPSVKFTLASSLPNLANNFITFGSFLSALFIAIFVFIGFVYVCITLKIHAYTT